MSPKDRLLVLGSNGRLGRTVLSSIASDFETVGVGRAGSQSASTCLEFFSSDDSRLVSFLRTWQPQLVLNVASRWRSVTHEETWKSSFDFPRLVADNLPSECRKWVQIDSYFNLFYEEFGVDKDYYSYAKRSFANYSSSRNPEINMVQVYSPHLVGQNEPQGRLFESLVSSFFNRVPSLFSSGSQFVPYLHIEDAAAQIIELLKEPAAGPTSFQKVQLKNLANQSALTIATNIAEIMGADRRFAEFGKLQDRENEFYNPIPSSWMGKHLPSAGRDLENIVMDILLGVKTFESRR